MLASWIEPGDRGNQSIRFSRFGASLADDGSDLRWSEARTVHDGNGLFANWADRPAVRRSSDGSLIAHRLQKMGSGTYAYGVMLSRSTDEGASWSDLGWLHDDDQAVEHGFVSARYVVHIFGRPYSAREVSSEPWPTHASFSA